MTATSTPLAVPVNDSCATATLISALPLSDYTYTRNASTDAHDPYPSCGSGSRDRRVWYRYVALANGVLTLDTTGSGYNTIISGYTGVCGQLVAINNGCDAGQYYTWPGRTAQLVVQVSAGTTYYFMVSAANGDGGWLTLNATAGPPPPTSTPTPTATYYGGNSTSTPTPPPGAAAPANDACTDATTVTTLPFADTANVRGASTDATDPYPICGSHSRDRRVWYRYVAPADGAITLDTTGSTYNLIISAYTGTCGALVPVDGACAVGNYPYYYYGSSLGRLSLPVSAGVAYYFMVSAGSVDYWFKGNLSLQITAGTPAPTATATPTPTWTPTSTPVRPAPPQNDSCSDGTMITTLPFSDIEDVRSAGTDETDPYPSCGTHSRDRGVWYHYVPAADGAVTVDTAGSNYNAIVSAYTGACEALVPVENGCATVSGYYGSAARLVIPVRAGVPYSFMISTSSVDYYFNGSLALHVTSGMPTSTPTLVPTAPIPPTPVAPPPPNDGCADATLISGFPFKDVADVHGASTDAGDPYPNCGSNSRDRRVWYRYVAPATGAITFNTTGSNYDTIISAYSGTCGALVPLENGCAAGYRYSSIPSQLSVPVSAGQTYYVMVSAGSVDSGFGGTLSFQAFAGAPTPTPTLTRTPTTIPTAPAPPPLNDRCSAGMVVQSLPFTDLVDVRSASTDAHDPYPSCGTQSRDRRVWYQYVAQRNGTITADTAGSTYAVIVSAYTGACGELLPVANGCDAGNNSYPATLARLTIPVTIGTTYYFMVSASDLSQLSSYAPALLKLQLSAGGSTGIPTPQPTLGATAVPPPNDSCNLAGEISAAPFTDIIDTRGASTGANDPYPSCGNHSRDRRVWYKYVAPASGMITLDTLTSSYQAIVSAYSGSCDALEPVDGGCDAGSSYYYGSYPAARLSMPVSAGMTYYFMVSAADYRGGTLALRLLPGAPSPTPTATPTATYPMAATPVPPPNDACDLPAEITGLPYVDMVDTRGASLSADDPFPSCGTGSRDRRVWYRYVAPTTGAITLGTAGSTYGPIISAYTGSCGALQPVANGCSASSYSYYQAPPQLSIPVVANTTYYFMISASSLPGGILELTAVSGTPVPTPTPSPSPTSTQPPTPVPPPNDSCRLPAEITSLPYFDLVDTRGASTDPSDPYPRCGNGSHDRRVWYRFVAPNTGVVTLDTAGSTYQPILSVYTGTCGSLVPVDQGCDAGYPYYYTSGTAHLSIPVNAGVTYYFQVSASSPPGGILRFSMVTGQLPQTPTPTTIPATPTPTLAPTPVPPPNDACRAPAVISTLPYFDLVDTSGASTSAEDPYPGCGTGSRDRRVWYRFDAPQNGLLRIDTTNSSYSHIVSVYTGTCGALVPVSNGCSSDNYSRAVQLTVPVTDGTSYYVMVSGSNTYGGVLEFSAMAVTPAPTPPPTAVPMNTMAPTPPEPPNDACDAPAEITALPYFDWADTRGASTSARDPYPSCGGGGRDRRVWYRFVAPADGLITLDTAGSNYTTIISAYAGTCGALVPAADACNLSNLTMPVTAGTTYHIMVSSTYLSGGLLSLKVSAGAPSPSPTPVPPQTPGPPPNDHCSSAQTVPAVPYVDQLSLVGAGADITDPISACAGSSPNVWYRVVAPVTGTLTIGTSSTYYSSLAVSAYTGTCGSLLPVSNGCHVFNYGSGDTWKLMAARGTTYFLMVSGTYYYADFFMGLRISAESASCAGDCSGDGSVTVNEVLMLVNVALGNGSIGDCPPADTNHDGSITIDEILQAVGAALNGCPTP